MTAMSAAGRRWGRAASSALGCSAGCGRRRGAAALLVPEEMPKGSFVGDVAKDLGCSYLSSAARRHVFDTGRRRYFFLDLGNGHLSMMEQADREEICAAASKCVLNFEILVKRPMNIYKGEVEILDINDNSPSFPERSSVLEISESTAPGTRFPLQKAHDPDIGLNSLQNYECSESNYFTLDVKNGDDGVKYPELILVKSLDREQQTAHNLILTATDSGSPVKSGSTMIQIIVLDGNDNAPEFTQSVYKVTVREDVAVGSRVLQVTAIDRDEGPNAEVKYSFFKIPETFEKTFKLNPESGEIEVTENLNFEEREFYELVVQARDAGGLSSHSKVLIKVVDVNNYIPEIVIMSVFSPVPEDTPQGTVIAIFSVQDRDSGANGEVQCSISESHPFRLEKSFDNYYSVVTTELLDREQVSEYNVTVRAADGGSPPLQSSAVLALRVLDVNDNAPVFAQERYSARLAENNAAGALVLTVRASDADWGQNARVRYRLSEGRVRGAPLSSYVSVQAETGALYALRSFDYEQVRELELWVRAEDGGAPALSSNVSVRLLIVDENDNAPQVLYPPAAPAASLSSGAGWSGVELAPRSSEPGALVAKVVAVDADAGQNAWLSYELAKATEPGLFRVGLHSGEVRTARFPLARDAARHSLVVLVKDHGRPALSATATLSVVLAESVAELLAELGSAADAAAPGEPAGSLTRWLVLAVAAVSCLFLAFLLLLLALRLRRWRREQLLAASSGALRGVPVSHFVGIDGVRAFLAADAAAPGEPAGSLTRWLVLAVAAVSCLFLAFLLLLLALRLRRWRREQLLAASSGALRGVPVSHFVGIDGVRAFLQSYSHEVSLTADSRKSQLRFSGASCCDTLPARPLPDEPAPLLGDENPAVAPPADSATAPVRNGLNNWPFDAKLVSSYEG
uniref:Cadherin domain-containing protein n=1 Tax=Malurus cyaneus samueli TaxID=2593467 RepID=A0A8C5UGK6_9PASS